MKKLYFFFVLFSLNLVAQTQNQWTWVGGSKTINNDTIQFGLIGHEDVTNWPGGRMDYNGVVDSTGKIWFFGGANGSDTAANTNSLWVYDPATNNFTFKKGDLYKLSNGFSKGLNTVSYVNNPSYRGSAQMWIDNEDVIWLLSGDNGWYLNDMWKYEIATGNWIQVKESSTDAIGDFGTIGVEASTNVVPGTIGATTWVDNAGDLWMFGGKRRDGIVLIFEDNYSNALWKYNKQTNSWTWMSGSSDVNIFGTYGALGTESALNQPGSRAYSCGWTDAQGNLWLFGGQGPITLGVDGNVTQSVKFNDVWMYNPVTNLWTWVKGDNTGISNIATTGTEDAANKPIGNDVAVANWKDAAGNFWMYGSNDDQLWKYNPLTNNWTFVKGGPGTDNSDVETVYGTIGVPNSSNTPGTRKNTMGFKGANGKFYIFGGNNGWYEVLQDMWQYDSGTNNWTWLKGCGGTAVCDVKAKVTGKPDPDVRPLLLHPAMTNWGDNEGNLWLYTRSNVNDAHMWKYNTTDNTWQWIRGNFSPYQINDIDYGTKGLEAATNNPGERFKGMQWTDLNGNLWVYGGGSNRDLWKYNVTTNNWVWVHGIKDTDTDSIIYGTKGVAAPDNRPGSRFDALTWIDSTGDLWMYGGYGLGGTNGNGWLNDLWKYNIATNQWTWVSGSQETSPTEVSVGIGIESPENTPGGAVQESTYWIDNNNNLWIFKANSGVWKYNIAQNMWTKTKELASANNYGTMGVEAATNGPVFRSNAASWTESNGDLLLYGGEAYTDLWRYSVTTNMWTWVGGSIYGNFQPNYGIMGEMSYTNNPGVRKSSITWSDNNGNRYLYGSGSISNGDSRSDIWKSNGQFNTISGRVTFDADNNGCGGADSGAPNIKVNISGATSGFVFTDEQGYYTVFANQGEVTITPENTYFVSDPVSQTFDFTGFQNTAPQDFCLTANIPQTDVEVTLVPPTEARPGFDATYKIIYTNKGNTVASGNVQMDYDDAILDYISADVVPEEQLAGMLKWSYTDLMPFETTEILVTLNVNGPMETPAVDSGDILEYTVSAPVNGDVYADNNTFVLTQEVVNSLDPNDKTCLQGERIFDTEVGKYVTYMIRFENTGTASAINVVVKDAIDTSKFDISTLVPISASHDYRVEVTEDNVVSFSFINISLGFGEDNPLKHGYISFKIKTLASLEAGDVFSNKADIYFDYNFPVITNEYSTEVEELLSNNTVETADFSFYPNPVKNILNLNTELEFDRAEIYDISGRVVLNTFVDSKTINVTGLNAGVYFIKLGSGKTAKTIKIIKE